MPDLRSLGFTPSLNITNFSSGNLRPQEIADKSIDWNLTSPSLFYGDMLNKEYEYNKHIEQREDSAVQRWAEDVRKAGLNPWAFTGSGASTSSLPSPNKSAFESMLNYLNFDLSKASLDSRNILGAVKIGAGLASSIIGALG